MLLDEDTSYLDSTAIPDPPNTVPQTTGGQTNVSVQGLCQCVDYVSCCYRMELYWMNLVSHKFLTHKISVKTKIYLYKIYSQSVCKRQANTNSQGER